MDSFFTLFFSSSAGGVKRTILKTNKKQAFVYISPANLRLISVAIFVTILLFWNSGFHLTLVQSQDSKSMAYVFSPPSLADIINLSQNSFPMISDMALESFSPQQSQEGREWVTNLVAILGLGTGILSEMEEDKYSFLRIVVENCSELFTSVKEGNILAILGVIKEEWFIPVNPAVAKLLQQHHGE